MKILVVGAAGKTGRAVVEQALAAGHEVTAFVHNADGYDVAGVRVFEAGTGEKAHKLTRADLASFMLAQLSSDEHLHRAVTIANG